MIYIGIMKPHLEYGQALWGKARSPLQKTLATYQKKAVRAIANAKYNAHSTPWFARLGLLKMEHLYQVNACKLVEKVIRKKVPENLAGLFQIVAPERLTRNSMRTQITSINNDGPLADLAAAWNSDDRKMAGASVNAYTNALLRDYLWHYSVFKCDNSGCYSCKQLKNIY